VEANAHNNRITVFSVVGAALAATQRYDKHTCAAVNQQGTIEEAVFSLGVAPRIYNEDRRQLNLELRLSPELALGRIIEKKWQERN
jgi:phage terminase Nu1 subunit (DNA packaging protein)